MSWTIDNVASQAGRTFVVTGANTGLGYTTAEILAAKQARVLLACRSEEKGRKAVEKIKRKHPAADVALGIMDLGSLASVRDFAAHVTEQEPRLDVLINNAGVGTPPLGFTTDGFEQQFGINFLGHFALTGLLLPLLEKTPAARVVGLSSLAHKSGKLVFDNLNAEKRYSKLAAYAQSKLAVVMFAYELQRRLAKAGSSTLSVAVHPGIAKSDLARNGKVEALVMKLAAQPTEQGVLPTLRAAIDKQIQGGDYLGPSGFLNMRGAPVVQPSSSRSYDAANASRLWQVAEELTGVTFLSQ